MSTNKYSKFVVDSIVLGTPIGSLTAAGGSINDIEGTDLANAVDGSLMVYDSATSNWVATTDILVDSGTMTADFFVGDGSQLTNVSGALDSDAVFEFLSYRVNPVGTNQKQVAISLNTLVDPFDQTGTDDRAFNLNYTSTTGFYVRENAGRTELHADASGSGLSTGMLLTGAAFSETGTEIAGNVKLSGLPTSDPAEAGLLWNDGGIPVFSGSTAPSGGAGIDSADVVSIVDAPYVQARQTPQDFAYSSLTGAPTALSSFTNDTNYITAADIPATVDSDYVQARVTLDGVGLDSAGVTALVDSDYVALRAPAGGGLDSAAVIATMNEEFKITTNQVEIGSGAAATNGAPVAIGRDALAKWTYAVAVGQGAEAGNSTKTADVAIGFQAIASGSESIALGRQTIASSLSSIAIGNNADATSNYAIAIGDQATANFEDAIAIGRSSISSQADTIAMGTTAVASGSRSIAIGNGTDVTGNSGIALGNSAQSLGSYAVAIGPSADTNTHSYAVAIGMNTEISGNQGVAIGQNAAAANAGVALGLNSSTVTGTNSTAVGAYAGTTGADALALGRGAKANADNTIVLAATGSNSTVTSQFGIDIRTSDSGSAVYSIDSDWQFGATVNAPAFIGDGSGLTNLPSGGGLDSAGVQLLIDAEVQDPTTLTLGASSNAGIGIGSGVVTSGLSGGSVSIGTNANSSTQSVAIGSSADASGTGSVSVGPNTQASGNFNTAIGRQATTSGSNSLALGYSSSAGNLGIALGDAASGQRSIAIGALASATNNGALHINANYNSGVGPTADGGLVIETSAARLEYSAASDWTFGAGVTMTDLTASGVVIFSALPTTDPVNAGQLWNDGGTLKVSAG